MVFEKKFQLLGLYHDDIATKKNIQRRMPNYGIIIKMSEKPPGQWVLVNDI
jgi:hypothetical protein